MRRRLAAAAVAVALVAEPAAAHAGALSDAVGAGPVPSWLLVLTGGVVVAGSFLFASLLTDHAAIAAVNGWRLDVPVPGRRAMTRVAGVAGVAGLAAILAVGLVGPLYPTRNLAILWVWGGWWAGYTITVYAVGNTWTALNPWRTLSEWLATAGDTVPALGAGATRRLPGWVNPWGSVAGLLGLVWLEVVSPVAGNPRFLSLVVLAYTAVTLAGARLYGVDDWFREVDPIARVFRIYGRLAPVGRTDAGLGLRLPGTALAAGPADENETAFVVALLWATTYDGLVATPAWADLAWALLGDRPALALPAYLLVLVAGYALFLGVYRVAARRVRERADTYVTVGAIERWFVPSLVPIAAGYHLAHYLGYFVSLSPALVGVATAPLSGTGFPTQALPAWFGNLQLSFVVFGHLLAVYVAHGVSFDLFPGALAAIRSQYPFVAVMVFYTMTSVWIITQPFVAPPLV